jgi:cytosine permease
VRDPSHRDRQAFYPNLTASHDHRREHFDGYGLEAIPVRKRLHWTRPTMIYASCMISLPVIMVGALLMKRYSFSMSLLAIAVALAATMVFDWINAALGGDLGRPASMISRSAFGSTASRLLVSTLLVLMCLGWFGIQIEVTSHLTLLAFGVHPSSASNQTLLYLAIVGLGLLFSLPAVLGTRLFSWINYAAIAIILLVEVGGVILTFIHFGGWSQTFAVLLNSPNSGAPLSLGVTSLIGIASAQFLMLADYSRYARRLIPDTFLIPFAGILPAGALLFLGGVFLFVNGGSWDIVQVLLVHLNLPLWAVVGLIFAQGSTVLVGAYSAGLALANMMDVTNARSRSGITFIAVLIGIGAAMLGLLARLESFLFFIALACPVVGAILAIDHFLLRDRAWQPRRGVNWVAVLAAVFGFLAGALLPGGYPTFLAIFTTSVMYYGGMWLQAKVRANQFTPDRWRKGGPPSQARDPLALGGLGGLGSAAVLPLFLPTPWAEIAVLLGCLAVGWGFFLKIRSYRRLAVEDE